MPVTIEITGRMRIFGLSPTQTKLLVERFSLPNPAYEKAVRANPKARYALSPTIPYVKVLKDGSCIVPRGAFESIARLLPGAEHEDRTVAVERSGGEDDRVRAPVAGSSVSKRGDNAPFVEGGSRSPGNRNGQGPCAKDVGDVHWKPIPLRPYQLGVTDAFKPFDGIGRLDTGFGKTVIALELARLKGLRTLIVVPKLDLLSQYQTDVRKFLGIEPGILTTKNLDVRDITITTIQTLQRVTKDPDNEHLRTAFGLLIADECHLYVPEKSRRAIEFFAPTYRYGLTGTARRSDGQGKAIEWIFGPILVDRKLPRSQPSVARLKYNEPIWTQEYAEMISDQISRDDRNDLIAKAVLKEIKNGRKVIVLTKRVDHYLRIEQSIRKLQGTSAPQVAVMDSSAERLERAALLRAMKDKPWDAMLGTYSLLGTGIDIPGLDTLILAGDLKSDVLTEQSAGRILRLFDDKQPPLIVDVQDTNNFILKRQAREREQFYKSQGWEVKDYDLQQNQ